MPSATIICQNVMRTNSLLPKQITQCRRSRKYISPVHNAMGSNAVSSGDNSKKSSLSVVPLLTATLRCLPFSAQPSSPTRATEDSELSSLRSLLSNGQGALPLLLSAAPLIILPPTSIWSQLGNNYVFMAGFWGWFLAQFLKIFTKWYKTGIFTIRAFFDSGGMPSSHSSLCSAVTTAIALQHGLSSPLFAICTCFTVIVMYDAMGVRRHAGLQAEVLNAVVKDLLENHPVSERKLKEVLGHTPRQVVCGAVLGLVVGLIYPRPF